MSVVSPMLSDTAFLCNK